MLPSINLNPADKSQDYGKQLASLRTQMASLKDAIEDELNSISYGQLDADLRKRIDNLNDMLKLSNENIEMAVGSIKANYATIDSLDSAVARIGVIEAGYVTADYVSANFATFNFLSANYASYSWVSALDAMVGNLNAKAITTENLSAQSINAGQITAGTLNVDRIPWAQATNLWASSSLTVTGTTVLSGTSWISRAYEVTFVKNGATVTLDYDKVKTILERI